MCFDPISLAVMAASTAMSLGGGLIQANEQEKSATRQAQARNYALQQYLQQQQEYERQAQAVNQQSIDQFQQPAQQQQQQTAETARQNIIQQNMPTTTAADVPLAGSAPSVVRDEYAKRLADANQRVASRGASMAELGSFGDSLNQNALNMMDSGRRIDTINNFSRQATAMLPSQQDLAGYAATKPTSGLGSLLIGLGNLGGAAAGSGKLPGYFS